MEAADQRYRVMLFDLQINHNPKPLVAALGVPEAKLSSYLVRQMQRIDSANLVRMRAILKQHGYPGKSLVGEPTNETGWLIIQHSTAIKQYLPIIKLAAEKGELPFFRYAMMLDRQLMSEGKEQVYGTQALNYTVVSPATGKRESQPLFVWPIQNPTQVNQRRKRAGFEKTVEEQAAGLGIKYRVVTLKEVARMPKK